jgi:membrane protease YdiL (CAAX protease family)
MAKTKKIVSFDTMNRKEYIADVISGVMVAGILVCVSRGLLSFPIGWIETAISGGGWQFYLRTLLTAVISAIGLKLPLYIYGLLVDSPVKQVFKRSSEVPTLQKVLYGILGSIAAISVAIICLKASFTVMDWARADGYIFTMNSPAVGNGPFENLFFILVYSLVPALICEPFYRGVVINRLSNDSYLLAVLIPAIIFAANHPNIPQMPYMLLVGIILGWIYLKTEDVIVPMVIHALVNGVISYLYVKAGSAESFTLSGQNIFIIMGITLLAAIIMAIILGVRIKKHTSDAKPFSVKESLKGLFGTFGVYVLAIIVIIQLGYLHIDNPTFEIGDGDEVQEEIVDEESGTNDEIQE